MNLYDYNGPVLEFDKVVANHWSASTRAQSEKKARCNLAYQFKKAANKPAMAKITLNGEIKMVG